jgi:hypothetical protein
MAPAMTVELLRLDAPAFRNFGQPLQALRCAARAA